MTDSHLLPWLFPLRPLRLCGETLQPCHQPAPTDEELWSDSSGPLQVLGTDNTVPLVEQVEVPDRCIRWDFCRNLVVLDFGRNRFPLAVLPFPQILGEA